MFVTVQAPGPSAMMNVVAFAMFVAPTAALNAFQFAAPLTGPPVQKMVHVVSVRAFTFPAPSLQNFASMKA
jgi:hypothetical protein